MDFYNFTFYFTPLFMLDLFLQMRFLINKQKGFLSLRGTIHFRLLPMSCLESKVRDNRCVVLIDLCEHLLGV
jgi:hypothetical protein